MENNDLSFTERFINHIYDDECACYTDDEGFHPCKEQEELHRIAREERELKENIWQNVAERAILKKLFE